MPSTRFVRLIAGLAVLLILAGCGDRVFRQQSYVFGTLVELTVYGEPEDRARRVTNHILGDFDAMHRSLHAWEPGDLDTVNAALARGRPGVPVAVALPPSLAPILRDAARLSALGEGLFNPAIGNLVRLWGFHSDTFAARLPDENEIARLVRANPRMSNLAVQGDTLVGSNPAVRLDLGGYAKGYALDRAAAYLRSQGVSNALINIGGNIMALGGKGRQPWRVGIQHPRRAGALATLALKDGEAIGTSGDYQRYFELAGKRYCHLIDPRTGWPADQTQSVTVIARGSQAGTLSDVASKPLFIAGPQHWLPLAAKLGVAEVLHVAADGRVTATPAMAARLTWEAPAPQVVITE